MSSQIPVAFVEGFKASIYMLAAQKNSRLFATGTQESQNSKTDYYERIGNVDAVDITTRHGDTPIIDVPHSRRACTLKDAEFGAMIDDMDKLRLLIQPQNAYAMRAVQALNRKKDDVFITSALGAVLTGVDGDVSVSLPITQKLAAVAEDANGDGTGVSVPWSVHLLRKVGAKFDANEMGEDESRYISWSSAQKMSFLGLTKATSQDFASVKNLVDGNVNSFMGFEFIRSELLPYYATPANLRWDIEGNVTSEAASPAIDNSVTFGGLVSETFRRCFSWVGSAMVSATGEGLFVRISERDDKRYSTQVYARHSVGAARMEEIGVIEIFSKEP